MSALKYECVWNQILHPVRMLAYVSGRPTLAT